MQVLSIGEVLWDVFPAGELLGGAPLNFAASIVRLGDRAALIAAVGHDARGCAAQQQMVKLGIDTEFVQVVHQAGTGVALVRMSAEGEPQYEIPRPAAFDFIAFSPHALDAAIRLHPEWLYFGTLLQMQPDVEETTHRLARMLPDLRCFYDMNLRPGSWELSLVRRLCALASIVKLNEFEARTLGGLMGMDAETFSLAGFCEAWTSDFKLDSICVTLGAAGCMVYQDGIVHAVPGYPVAVKDTVGAGDAFSAAFLHGFHFKWPVLRTAQFANAVGSIVASRAGATPDWSIEESLALASSPGKTIGENTN